MTIPDVLPTKKVTAFLLGGAVTIAGFWVLIERGALGDWPEAPVLASFTLIIGFIFAWFVPESTWKKVRGHLTGSVDIEGSVGDSDISGDVMLTPTGDGTTADIEGEVDVDEEGEIVTGDVEDESYPGEEVFLRDEE